MLRGIGGLSLMAFVSILATAFFSVASAAGSIGFVQGNIWYSKDPFFAGDTVRVYSAIFNGQTDDIVGSVTFYDNGEALGSMPFTATSGKLREVWTDWKATTGEHTISAKITEAFISKVGTEKKPVALATTESGIISRDVDSDTDADGIGNREDLDDDNDGATDVEEFARGTNPLMKDSVIKTSESSGNNLASGLFSDENKEAAVRAAASVMDTIDSAASDARVPVLKEKQRVEVLITGLEKKESTYTQSVAGSQINDALGSELVVASRPVSTPTDTIKRVGLQIYRGALIAALYVLDHKVLLYVILGLVAAKILYSIIRRFIPRRSY